MKAHSETSTFLVTLLSHPEGGRKNTDVSHCMFGERSYSQAGSAFTPEVPIAGTWSRQGRISEKREDFFYAAFGGGHCCPHLLLAIELACEICKLWACYRELHGNHDLDTVQSPLRVTH